MLMTCIETAFLIGCFFANILQESLFAENLFQVTASTACFGCWALQTYTQHREEEILEMDTAAMKEDEVLILLLVLNQSLREKGAQS